MRSAAPARGDGTNSVLPRKAPPSATVARRFFPAAVFGATSRVTSRPVRRSRQEGPAGAGGVPQCAAAAGALGAKARGVALPTMQRGAPRAVRGGSPIWARYVASFSRPFPPRSAAAQRAAARPLCVSVRGNGGAAPWPLSRGRAEAIGTGLTARRQNGRPRARSGVTSRLRAPLRGSPGTARPLGCLRSAVRLWESK